MITNQRSHQYLLTIIVIVLAVSLVSCAPAQPTDPKAIILASNEYINQGNVDGFMKFFAEDAVMADEHSRTVGSQAIQDYMQKEIVDKDFRFEISDLSVDGNIVTYTCHTYMGNMDLGTYPGLDVIKDGKIIFEGSVDVYQLECDKDPSQRFCSK